MEHLSICVKMLLLNVLILSIYVNQAAEALSVWKPRMPSQSAPPDQIQHMFNQMQLYPTKRQVQDMLQASRRCSTSVNKQVHHFNNYPGNDSPATSPIPVRNARADYSQQTNRRNRALSFAEFCLYAAELRCIDRQPLEVLNNKKNSLDHCHNSHRIARNVNDQHIQTSQVDLNASTAVNRMVNSSNKIDDRVSSNFKCEREYEVFLGGSCNPTTWRTDKAIPALEKLGISYYNPQVSHWSPELIEIEYRAKQCARVMFFVMDDETRSTAGSVEVAEVAAEQRSLVLVIRPYRPGQSILNEKLSPQEYMDLSRNQQILQELVESRGLPVLSTIEAALVRTKQLIDKEIISTVQTNGIDVSTKLIELKKTFDAVDLSGTGYITVKQCVEALSQLGETSFDIEINEILSNLHSLSKNDALEYSEKQAMSYTSLDFQQFCGIVAEIITRKTIKSQKIDKDNANDIGNMKKLKQIWLTTKSALDNCIKNGLSYVIEWVNKQVIYRQSSSNNNTVDNLNVNSSTMALSYNAKDDGHTNLNYEQNNKVQKSRSPNDVRDLYLGGSCMIRTKWRQQLIIPILEERGISFHLPKLHESLMDVYREDNFMLVYDNSASALSMSSGSDKSEINRPGKRIKYDSIMKNPDELYNSSSQRSIDESTTRANLKINLIDIDRSSSGSSISTASSLNSPVAAEESFANFNPNTDMSEKYETPENASLYNPQLIESSRVLLFYITNETRSLAPMTLAAFCIGEGRKVVLCIEMLNDDAKIGQEQLTRTAIKDFNRGRAYLADLAKRQGVPVFQDILLATERAIAMVKGD